MIERSKTADYDGQLDAQCAEVEQAIRESVREAIELHKRLGLPMVEGRDGQVILVPPDKLDPDDEPAVD